MIEGNHFASLVLDGSLWVAFPVALLAGLVSFASPCSGHGYKFATVIAEILADLATEGETRHPIEMFSSQRFGVGASRLPGSSE